MFMLGAYVAHSVKVQAFIMSLNSYTLVFSYIILNFISASLSFGTGNEINVVSYLLLAAIVFQVAYKLPVFSDRILGRNDYSYGIYIYHMPIINVLLFYGISQSIYSLLFTLALTFAFAAASWHFVERPALRLKKHALRRI